MKKISFFLIVGLLILCSCDDNEPMVDAGPVFNTSFYIELVNEKGENLFDSPDFDEKQLYVNYQKGGAYSGRSHGGLKFVKGKECPWNIQLNPEATYLHLNLDITRCGYPFYTGLDHSLSSLDGAFRLEYLNNHFQPIQFKMDIKHYELNVHYNVVDVTGDVVLNKKKEADLLRGITLLAQ